MIDDRAVTELEARVSSVLRSLLGALQAWRQYPPSSGPVERAVTELLGSPQTTFLVVSTLEVAPSREAAYFLSLLAERRYHVGALVLNKVLPDLLLDRPATQTARTLAKHGAEVGAELDEQLGLGMPHVGPVLTEIGRSFLDYQVVARRESEQRRELAAIPDLTLTVPYFDDDIHSLEGLLRLGEGIWT